MKNKIRFPEQTLFNDLSQLIEQSKNFVIIQTNSVMTMLFWNVGKRINEDILKNKRADYGKQIVATLAQQLTEKYGKNFELRNLRRMMQFAELFPELEIVVPLARQLSWSHFQILIPLKNEKAREFYAKEAAERHWGKRELRQSIERKEFERTETLKRLVAIELKLGKFKAEYKGKMELYLKWLNRNERQEGENEPIGLLLCAEGNREQIELLEMHKDGIMVAEYWTELPPKKLLEQKIREIIIETRELFERNKQLKA